MEKIVLPFAVNGKATVSSAAAAIFYGALLFSTAYYCNGSIELWYLEYEGGEARLINVCSYGKRKIEYWKVGAELGRGSYGIVYKATDQDGLLFALKETCIEDCGNKTQLETDITNEVTLLNGDAWHSYLYFPPDLQDLEIGERLYIFLELVEPGSLEKLYRKQQLPESLVSVYTQDILYGLIYLHDHSILHRDLKCANILVDHYKYVKLADFGLAKKIDLLEGTNSCKGTLYWMAPEVIRKEAYGPPADIWSLGCTVLEMLTRKHPYSELEPVAAAFKTAFCNERPPIPSTLSNYARDFIEKCLRSNPEDRPSGRQLLEDRFVMGPLFW